MKITGGCHCGKIRYEAEIDPEKAGICHCTDCQTLSGSAFATLAMTYENAFELKSGELKFYIKTAESGNERVQAFCPDCGTRVYATSPDPGPKVYAIRPATADQPNEMSPKFQVWTRSQQPWLANIDSIHKVEKQ